MYITRFFLPATLLMILFVTSAIIWIPSCMAESSAQVTVNQNGDGDFILSYTGSDYDVLYLMYLFGGDQHEEIFKGDIVTWGLTFGWNIDVSSISIDVSEPAKSMTVTFTVRNLAEQVDGSNWQINLTSIKAIYPSVTKIGGTYQFNSIAKPELPLPESVTLYLPHSAFNVQFNSENYQLSYQTSITSVAINFQTDPSNTGSVTFDGVSSNDGTSISKNSGTYSITANPASGYSFSRWEVSGSISINNPNSPSTTCNINGNCTIKMVQTSQTQTPPPQTGCIIATATYGSSMAPEVIFMRNARDNMIGSTDIGKTLVTGWNAFYYSWSPPIAEMISKNHNLQPIFQSILMPLVATIHVTAFSYNTVALIDISIASMIGFLVAAFLSTLFYLILPLSASVLLYRKTRLLINQK
ncbi:MAG: CFI-box-CTERM domain-containing protein [Candidatus Bathyarchaeia archaeon]